LGQWFAVDVTLWVDLAQAGASDRIEHTLDYRAVIATVKHLVSTSKFALVERLAEAIAEAILQPTEADTVPIEQVRVCLSKLAAPIPDFGGKITIDITRSRR
jgi:dihydroneopterin aldolase